MPVLFFVITSYPNSIFLAIVFIINLVMIWPTHFFILSNHRIKPDNFRNVCKSEFVRVKAKVHFDIVTVFGAIWSEFFEK